MSLETTALEKINQSFEAQGKSTPPMHWQYGTLWIETESKEDISKIEEVMKQDVLSPKYSVQFSEMKPTDREPWTEWAMDVVDFRG